LGAAIARLIVISGPSGAGKGTLIKRVMPRVSGLTLSVSATTRPQRVGERQGRDYFFISESEFNDWIREGLFLEWAEYAGNLYGTPALAVERHLEAGYGVILEIELKGAEQILAKCPKALMIFIVPPSLEELERRLRGRPALHHVIVNDSVKRASAELAAIIERIKEEDEQAYSR
jgi:guanylate kinase